ncbi:Ribosome-associated protein, partial [Dysosmobacter welbionis]
SLLVRVWPFRSILIYRPSGITTSSAKFSFSVMVYSPLLVSLLYACVASMAALTESYSVVPPFCSMVTADSSRR